MGDRRHLDDNSGCILFEDDYGQNYEDEKVTSESDQETTDVTRMTMCRAKFASREHEATSQARVFIPSRATAKTLVQAGHVGLYEFIA